MKAQSSAGSGCAALHARLSALLDGELTPTERREVDAHLAACPRCAAELEEARRARTALRGAAPSIEAPAALRGRVQAALIAQTARPPRWRRVLPYAGLAAAVCVAALLGLLVFASRQIPSRALLQRSVNAHQQETLSPTPVSFASANADAVRAWLQQQTGREFDVPALGATGLQLAGARLDPTIAAHAVTLVYRGQQGFLTCVILPSASPSWLNAATGLFRPGVQTASLGQTSVASWVEPDGTYIMAADLQPAQLALIAHAAAESGAG